MWYLADISFERYFRYHDARIRKKPLYFFFKRIIDIVLSIIGMIIGIPLMLAFGIAIKIESNGPVIYKQVRLGKDKKPFTIYKLRSMYVDAEKYGPKWADKDDSRITKVGRFIRKTRIDEIPQLFNIIKGDMGIVGPRPERPSFTMQFNREIPGFINRLNVKPGLTGLAQVNGGYDIKPGRKYELDMEYIDKMGFFLDLKIMLKTVYIVFTGAGAR